MHYYFRLICFEYKAASIGYFLDEMLLSELADILDALQFSDRVLWQTQRLTAYMMAQTHCSKKLKLTDIYRLPFDSDNTSEKLTPEDIKELREREQAVEDFINEQVRQAREQAAQTDNKTE